MPILLHYSAYLSSCYSNRPEQESLATHRAPPRAEQLCPADYTLVRAKIEHVFAGQSWIRGLSSFRADTKRLWRGLSAEPLRQLSR